MMRACAEGWRSRVIFTGVGGAQLKRQYSAKALNGIITPAKAWVKLYAAASCHTISATHGVLPSRCNI